MIAPAASFDETVLEVHGDDVRLIAAWCSSCEANSFPFAHQCPRCGSPTSRRLLSETGTIHSRATINAPVTIHPLPATIVQVVLDDVRIGGWLRRGSAQIDAPCRLLPLVLERDGEPVTAYCFETIDDVVGSADA